MNKEKVIRILMRRDGLEYDEAKEIVNDAILAINEAVECGDYELAEDIMAGDLGLEIDYVFCLL